MFECLPRRNMSTRTVKSQTLLLCVQVRDLLCADGSQDMELQKTATGFTPPGLTKVPVTSAEQITEVMSAGYENRCTAAHDINAHSSRSHALLIVEVASTNLASGIRSVGKLTLCDLAGRCVNMQFVMEQRLLVAAENPFSIHSVALTECCIHGSGHVVHGFEYVVQCLYIRCATQRLNAAA